MSGALTKLRQGAADLLNERGILAMAAFEPDARKVRTEPVVAVSLAKVKCQTSGFQDYLGVQSSHQIGASRELRGRAVELTLALDIYGPRDSGESACCQVLDQMAEVLLTEGVAGLPVRELESGTAAFLDSCGMYRLPVQCVCGAWLTVSDQEDGEFVDFRVKGRTV